MLTVRQLAKHYGARAVFRGVSFEVARGSVAAIVGANGAGKSTLLKILAGLVRPARGEILWGETDLRRGLFAPDAPVYRELSVQENLEFFAHAQMQAADLAAHLARFHLAARRHDLAGDLSSGWRARLQLCVATLGAPGVLLLDEASAHLDADGLELLRDVIQEQRERGIALLATNDPRQAAQCDFQITL